MGLFPEIHVMNDDDSITAPRTGVRSDQRQRAARCILRHPTPPVPNYGYVRITGVLFKKQRHVRAVVCRACRGDRGLRARPKAPNGRPPRQAIHVLGRGPGAFQARRSTEPRHCTFRSTCPSKEGPESTPPRPPPQLPSRPPFPPCRAPCHRLGCDGTPESRPAVRGRATGGRGTEPGRERGREGMASPGKLNLRNPAVKRILQVRRARPCPRRVAHCLCRPGPC